MISIDEHDLTAIMMILEPIINQAINAQVCLNDLSPLLIESLMGYSVKTLVLLPSCAALSN